MKRFLSIIFIGLFMFGSASAASVFSQPKKTRLTFEQISKQDLKAVVNISTSHTVVNRQFGNFHQFFGQNDPFERFFGQFFRNFPGVPRKYVERSLGSGFIITHDGYILTNNHVIAKADKIKVTLPDGRVFKGKVVGADKKTDIALVKIDAKNLPIIRLGDSSKVQIGDSVLAIGNPFGLNGTVTSGIISAKGRVIGEGPYDNFLQTDAAINPGNSGGPLVDMYGDAIGINTAIIASGQGIGFAIPINMAKELLPQLRSGHVERGYLGVYMQPVTADIKKAFHLKNNGGALVSDVIKGTPAWKAGIKRGDVIIKVDGSKIKNPTDLAIKIGSYKPGTEVDITVIRNGSIIDKKVKLSKATSKVAGNENRFTSNKKLGIEISPITPELKAKYRIKEHEGVVIISVEPGSPAAAVGLSPGDVILEVDREKIKDINDFERIMKNAIKRSPILFLVRRGKATIYITIDLG